MPQGEAASGDQSPKEHFIPEQYTVGWICALQEEYDCACRMLDDEFEGPETSENNDNNTYVFGCIGGHYVVVVCLPAGVYGSNSAAAVARDMARSFPNLRFALMVGIGGGAPTPERDIRLGDVVVSHPHNSLGGVVQYDLGKRLDGGEFKRTGQLNSPPAVLLGDMPEIWRRYNDPHEPDRIAEHMKRMDDMQEYQRPQHDRLYRAEYPHQGGKNCDLCSTDQIVKRGDRSGSRRQVVVHYGTIASGNSVIKDARLRDQYANDPSLNVLCYEMEAAGLMNNFPCLVIRGICDYCDSHKNDDWHNYAALAAAAYARELLFIMKSRNVHSLPSWPVKLANVEKNLVDLNTTVEHLIQDGQWNQINSWLSPPDISTNLNNAASRRYARTGTWFLDCEPFQQWKAGERPHLWLYGRPGCGKTVLSSTIIEQLHREGKQLPHVVVKFFFDFRDANKQTIDKMFRSLVTQLYTRSEKSRRELHLLMSKCEDGRRQPTIEALFEVLLSMLLAADDVQVIIDALDECQERLKLVKWIQKLIGLVAQGTHLLLTSRQEEDIEAGLRTCIPEDDWVPLQQNQVDNDIRAYTRGMLNGNNELRRWRSKPSVLEHIEVEIMKKANGMFRYATCQLDALKDCISPKEIQDALLSMPETLDETYARILRSIKKQHRPDAIRILQFLIYSDQPLTVDQLVDAMVVDISGNGNFDPEMRLPIPCEIMRICSSLLSLVEVPERCFFRKRPPYEVHLAHFSVKEYLMSERVEESFRPSLACPEARASITQVLLIYLSHIGKSIPAETISQHSDKYIDRCRSGKYRGLHVLHPSDYKFPLTTYSADNWMIHARGAEESILSKILQFFCENPEAYIAWCHLFIQDGSKFGDEFDPSVTVEPLYCASGAGLIYTVKSLLQNGANVNAEGGPYSTPLGAASRAGHVKVVSILINHGAQVNPDDKGRYVPLNGHALQIASYNGHYEIVQILIEHGAIVNAQEGFYGNALTAACYHGYRQIAETLIAHGANINAQAGFYGYSIVAAAYYGHLAIVRLLIDHGADVNAHTSMTALSAASERGHERIVQLLRDHGAEPNSSESEGERRGSYSRK